MSDYPDSVLLVSESVLYRALMEWITMIHPDLPDLEAKATKAAFDQVWKAKGWKLAGGKRRRKASPVVTEPETEE